MPAAGTPPNASVGVLARLVLVLAAVAFLAASDGSAQAVQDDDPEALASGLVARFDHPDVPTVKTSRTVPDLSWSWGDGSPDARLPAEGFRVVAKGSLLVQIPGVHRFLARTDGEVSVSVSGRVVAKGSAGEVRSEAIDLRPGFVPVEVGYRRGRGPARLAIDWEGPGFARELVPARLLYHDPKDAPVPDPFEEGRRLADRLGCANCHSVLDLPRHPGLGPPLDAAGRSIEPGWLDAWLRDPTSLRPETRMPAFGPGLSEREAADLSAFLRKAGTDRSPVSAEIRMALNVATPEKGRLLFRSRGCLGCHAPPEGEKTAPAPAPSAGPNLAGVGRKRQAGALAAYLEHPRAGKTLSRHRPDLRLLADDAAHLAAYLASIEGKPAKPSVASEPRPEGEIGRGKELADRLRCASCHAIPGLSSRPADLPLRAGSHSDGGCLADSARGFGVPRYALSTGEKSALRSFVEGLPGRPSRISDEARALDSVRRLNCLGCHVRDGQGGTELASRLAPLLAEDPALGGLKGTLTPPNLTAVGDKLRPEFLGRAVRGEAPVSRPWLSVRMPVFAFEPGEADSVASLFRNHDRVDPGPTSDPPKAPAPDRGTLELGARLIGQRGFGCVSCHVLAGRIPPGGEPETLGPDLALAHERMTERYFRRWIADPQRVIAGTPMPQFLKPISAEGVPDSLDLQFKAVWQLLGTPALAELAATGTREVLRREGDRALVVLDMVILPDAPDTPYTPRGLAMGLKNGASLLFDTDRLTWLAFWHGGFAYRTKSGRLWEWHPEGTRLWTAPKRLPTVALLLPGGTVEMPVAIRERFGTFRTLEFDRDGVVFRYQLNRKNAPELDVTESLQPLHGGWNRSLHVAGAPTGFRPVLIEQLPENARATRNPDEWAWPVGSDRVTLRVEGAEALRDVRLPDSPRAQFWALTPQKDGRHSATVSVTVTPR